MSGEGDVVEDKVTRITQVRMTSWRVEGFVSE